MSEVGLWERREGSRVVKGQLVSFGGNRDRAETRVEPAERNTDRRDSWRRRWREKEKERVEESEENDEETRYVAWKKVVLMRFVRK